jgi:valyl-tRNA synthetase
LSETGIPKTYDHRAVEARLYEEWERTGAFEADPNPDKPAYCIVLPPPNVTGALHMGHALNGSIQDTLARRARMKGYEALWLPGVDHASIALQNVVERKLLREEGKTKWDVGREEFIELCREFAEEARGTMLGQLKRLGASVDWRRLRYTMDEKYIDSVLTAFIELYNDGSIYRGTRIVNWCPRDRSAISDLEVNYEDTDGKLYGLRYPFSDGEGPGPTATTSSRSSPPVPRRCSGTWRSSSTRRTGGTRTSSGGGLRCRSSGGRSRSTLTTTSTRTSGPAYSR